MVNKAERDARIQALLDRERIEPRMNVRQMTKAERKSGVAKRLTHPNKLKARRK